MTVYFHVRGGARRDGRRLLLKDVNRFNDPDLDGADANRIVFATHIKTIIT